MNRTVCILTAVMMAGFAGLALAQEIDPLEAAGTLSYTPTATLTDQIPGQGLPLLEIEGRGSLFSDGAEFYVTRNGQKKLIGVLKRSGLRWTYTFTSQWPTRSNPQTTRASLSPTLSERTFALFTGDRNTKAGMVRQRFFSWGTGLDVFAPDGRRVGYIDEKAAQTFKSWGAKRPYAFQKVTSTTTVETTMFGRKKNVVKETEQDMFWFVDRDFDNIGPGGVFMTNDKVPFLAVKGSWWMSEHIFDLFTTRGEAEGAIGKGLRIVGTLLGDAEDARRINDESQELVTNPTAYLGVFLAGVIYLPEFRAAVAADLAIPAVQ